MDIDLDQPPDFARSAKVLLNLVIGHLNAQQPAMAEEVIRAGLREASEVGRVRSAKLHEALNQ